MRMRSRRRSSARFGSPFPRSRRDRKSTRLNSSHSQISYAVFCLKKKKELYHFVKLLRTFIRRLAARRFSAPSPQVLPSHHLLLIHSLHRRIPLGASLSPYHLFPL